MQLRSFLTSGEGWPYLLVPLIPLAIVLDVIGASAIAIFFVSAGGVIPTAALMGRATEELAHRSGPGIGGLLNVTFGNAPEIIIALFALNKGLHEVVKASLIGSMLGNILLVLGASMFIGGLGRDRQRFDRTAASSQSAMLLLAAVALVMPAIFELVQGQGLPLPGDERVHYDAKVEHLSLAVALVLIATYCAGLLFSLKTHREFFGASEPGHADGGETPWPIGVALVALAVVTVLVALVSEIFVESVQHAADAFGMTPAFVGFIIVALVGGAAEMASAFSAARKNRLDLSVGIALGSSSQIALFVAPVLVLLSYVLGPAPMDLQFWPGAVVMMLIAAMTASLVTSSGRSAWFVGVLLLMVYSIFAMTLYLLPPRGQ